MEQQQIHNKDKQKIKSNTTIKYVKLFVLISVNCLVATPSPPNSGH